jgi:hypothetical protein
VAVVGEARLWIWVPEEGAAFAMEPVPLPRINRTVAARDGVQAISMGAGVKREKKGEVAAIVVFALAPQPLPRIDMIVAAREMQITRTRAAANQVRTDILAMAMTRGKRTMSAVRWTIRVFVMVRLPSSCPIHPPHLEQ